MPSTKELVAFLQKNQVNTSFINKLKIIYRPLICPLNELINFVKDGDKVFDIGCGSGQFALLLAEFSKPSYISGVEIDQGLVKNANHLLGASGFSNFKFSKYDGYDFPEDLNEADLVFLIDVLHHVPADRQHNFLENLINQLKPGAKLVLKDINRSSFWVLFNKIHDITFSGEMGHEWKSSKAKDYLTDQGLKIVYFNEKRLYVFPHYTIIAKKG